MATLVYIEKVNPGYRDAFGKKVQEIASKLAIDANWLMQVMWAESRLNPYAQNRQSGRLIAAGLIQWTKASGVDPNKVLNLTAMQQLDLVYNYFKPYTGKLKSYFDVYLVTFFPAAVGKPDSYVFETKKYSAALIAAQNPAVNRNKDRQITMGEFKEYVRSTVPKNLWQFVLNTTATGGAAVLVLIGFFF